jgi:hypothetical protein
MPLWFKRQLELGMTGPDVRVLRRKLGLTDGPYDRTCLQLLAGICQRQHVAFDATVTADVAELLGSAADEELAPEWWQWDPLHTVTADELPEQLGYGDEDSVRRLQSSLGLSCTGQVDLDLARAMGGL